MMAHDYSAVLGQLLAGAEGDSVRPFKREHIFHDILDYCGEAEPAAGRMDMMYHHSAIRKLVASIRARQTAQITHFAALLAQSAWQPRSDIARAGIEALYHPAVALQAYYEDRYPDALAGLERGLEALGRLHASGFRLALVGAADQLLNLLRAHAAYCRHDAALASAAELLELLYGTDGSARFAQGRLDQALETADLASCANHYGDEVLLKVLGSDDPQLIGRLAIHINQRCAGWRDGPVRQALLLLGAARGGAHPAALAAATAATQLDALPSTLRLLLLTALLPQAGGGGGPHGDAVQARLLAGRLAARMDAAVHAGARHWLQALADAPPAMLAA